MCPIKKTTQSCNDALVETLFDLLYERPWISRYDPRSDGVYAEFKQRILLLARLLSRNELSDIGIEERRSVEELIHRLMTDVYLLSEDRVLPNGRVAEVLKLLQYIASKLAT